MISALMKTPPIQQVIRPAIASEIRYTSFTGLSSWQLDVFLNPVRNEYAA
jgi:hypothetical protein